MIKLVEFNEDTNHVNNIFHDCVMDDYVVLDGYAIVERECDQTSDGGWYVVGQPKPMPEIEKLRLEIARSNAEMFETILSMLGGEY